MLQLEKENQNQILNYQTRLFLLEIKCIQTTLLQRLVLKSTCTDLLVLKGKRNLNEMFINEIELLSHYYEINLYATVLEIEIKLILS